MIRVPPLRAAGAEPSEGVALATILAAAWLVIRGTVAVTAVVAAWLYGRALPRASRSAPPCGPGSPGWLTSIERC